MFKHTPTKFDRRLVIDLLIVLALIGAGVYYWGTIVKIVRQQYGLLYPCSIPITYSIGNVDEQFGVSKPELEKDLSQATAIWDTAAKKTLFIYATSSKDADVIVNLVYDKRQQTTDTLDKIGTEIENGTAQFNALRTQYEQQLADYQKAKATFDADLATYNAKKSAYEADVANSNARGGASRQKYTELQAEQAELTKEFQTIQSEQQHVNALAATTNQTGKNLNSVIQEHNLNVRTYNTIGATTGDEFEEGVYRSNAIERSITIFQFSNETKFIRVLAHEFGHALGLQHVDDQNAIMYKLNSGTNLTPTINDVIALKTLCKIK